MVIAEDYGVEGQGFIKYLTNIPDFVLLLQFRFSSITHREISIQGEGRRPLVQLSTFPTAKLKVD